MVYEQLTSVFEKLGRVSAIPDNEPLLAGLRTRPGEPIILGGVVLRGKIGEGGMAGIYLGWHTRLRFYVAIKVLKDPSPVNLPHFLREARLTVSVEHPNLVRIFDVNLEPLSGLHYIVMEYVAGCSAYQLLRQQLCRLRQPLSPLAALEIGLSTARALGAAHHQGILHRDVKSDNILIRESDGTVKLADLGLAGRYRRTVSVGEARHSSVSGTTGFISPEVLRGGEATPAADVYALGATLYELLSGFLPYGPPYDDSYYTRQLASQPTELRNRTPGVPVSVAKLVQRCLEPNPHCRYADGEDLARALEVVIRNVAGTKFLRAITLGDAKDQGKPVVLCVDDDPEVLEVLKDLLGDEGFKPVCFTEGQAALASLPFVKPDVAILDLNMPDLDGVQLCEKLRQVEGYEELAVLMLSGERRQDKMKAALERGLTDYLVKPVNSQELVVRVRLLSKLRAMAREKQQIESQLLGMRNGRIDPGETAGSLAALVRESRSIGTFEAKA